MKLPQDLSRYGTREMMHYWLRRGWAVFPLAPRAKEPLAESGGAKDASRDPAQIDRWCDEVPNANIGGICDRWVVVDIDPRSGGTVPDWLPPTRVHASGRGDGGQHLIYRLPANAPDVKSTKLEPGVDVKAGAGSYVLLPGSVHPDTGWLYVEGNQPMQYAPPELLERITRGSGGGGAAGPDNTRSMLSTLLTNPAQEGGRNDWLATVCGHYAKQYRRMPDLYWTQVALANQLLVPPLGDDEVNKTAQSIWDTELEQNADRDVAEDLQPVNGWLFGDGDRLVTMGWPNGAPRDDPAQLVEFADFNPKVLSVMVDPADGAYIYDIELHRECGDPMPVTLPSEVFGDPRTLRRILARHACSITAPKRLAHPTPDWSTRLMKYLLSQDAPRVEKAPHLGWNDDEQGYLTAHGVVDASGLREFRHVKPNLVELRESAPIDHEYRFESTRAQAVRVLSEVCTFQDADTVSVFGAWWAATLVKHHVRRHSAMFPVMAIEAASGSGKTSGFFDLMIQLSGSNDGAGQFTLPTLRNALASNSNHIVWVDDLDDPTALHEIIRVLTAGGSLSKMVNYTKTMRYPLVASLLLSGESLGLSDQKATLDRSILLHPPDPTGRRSTRGPYAQWEDIVKLRAELSLYGGGSGLAGHYVQMVAQESDAIAKLCEQLAHTVPSGRIGSWYLTLLAGARVLDYLTTDDRDYLTIKEGPFSLQVATWLEARNEPVTDDGGQLRTQLRNDNALTQKILPMFLANTSINPSLTSPVASIFQLSDEDDDNAYEVLVNTRELAEWWHTQRNGRVHMRTETDASFQHQVRALRSAYGEEIVSSARRRYGAGTRLRRYVKFTGPLAREIVLRSQD